MSDLEEQWEEEEEEQEEYQKYLIRVEEANASIALMKKYLTYRAMGIRIPQWEHPEIDGEVAACKMRLAACSGDGGDADEEFATIHLDALLHLLYDPSVQFPEGTEDRIKWYLGATYELAKSYILGMVASGEAQRRCSELFDYFVAINNVIDHRWTEGQKYVSAIHQNSEMEVQVANPNYKPPPEDFLAYLKYIKEQGDAKKAEEASHLRVKVVNSVVNDNFRLIQMSYFHEMHMLFSFVSQLTIMTTDTHMCNDMNNVGWVNALLSNPQCYLVVADIREKIYYGYVLPGNVREMQLSIETPLKQLKPRDILYQIGSPIYLDHISPYFSTNIGLLWDDLKAKGDMDMGSFVWDVRQNIILYFFYFLHLTQRGTGIDIYAHIFLVSIYTLRYEALTLEGKDGYLIGFARKWYLFQKEGRVSCYEGPHAIENALFAWSCYVYGRDHAFTALVGMIEEQALPDAQSTMDNVVTEGTYASTVMENSIFIK